MFDSEPVDVTRISAGALSDGSVGSTWRPPGEVLRGHVGDGTRSVMLATTIAPLTPRLSEQELVDELHNIDRMRARTETLTLHV